MYTCTPGPESSPPSSAPPLVPLLSLFPLLPLLRFSPHPFISRDLVVPQASLVHLVPLGSKALLGQRELLEHQVLLEHL